MDIDKKFINRVQKIIWDFMWEKNGVWWNRKFVCSQKTKEGWIFHALMPYVKVGD